MTSSQNGAHKGPAIFFARSAFLKLDRAALLLLAIVTVAYAWPILQDADSVYLEESYLQFCSFLELSRTAIIEHGQFALWSPYFGGGFPFCGHPNDMSMSPLFFMFILPCGVILGLKLIQVLMFLVGASGMYLLGRLVFRFNIAGAWFASCALVCSSFISYELDSGIIVNVFWFFLPWLVLFWEFSPKGFRYPAACAAVIALMVVNAVTLIFPPFILYVFLLFCFSLFKFTPRLSFDLKLFKGMIVVFIGGMLLSAPKLFPIIALLRVQSRSISDWATASMGAYNWERLGEALFNPGPFTVVHSIADTLPDGLDVSAVMYFGYIPLLMALLAALFFGARLFKHLALLVIFTMLAMAQYSPVNLFKALWHLPVFHSLYNAARYFSFPIVFEICIFFGACFWLADPVKLAAAGKRLRLLKADSTGVISRVAAVLGIIALASGGFAAIDMWGAGRAYLIDMRADRMPAPRAYPQKEFFQVKFSSANVNRTFIREQFSRRELRSLALGEAQYREMADWLIMRLAEIDVGMQYFLVRQNIGKIDWFGDIYLPANATPRYFVSPTRGDYWLYFERAEPTPWHLLAEPEKRARLKKYGASVIEKNSRLPAATYLFLNDPALSEINGIALNPDYRGEAYLDSGRGHAAVTRFSSNRICVTAQTEAPDTLVINQNYHRAWRSSVGSPRSLEGLIALDLERAGVYDVVFTFRPGSFYLGILCFLIALALGGWIIIFPGGKIKN